MEGLIKSTIKSILVHSNMFEFKRYIAAKKNIILTFHRLRPQGSVRNPYDTCPSISVETFRQAISLITNSFEIVSLRTLANCLDRKVEYASVTFDDGWRDTYTLAFPILKEFNAPATIFVSTGKIGQTRPFWQQLLGNHFKKAVHINEKEDQECLRNIIGLRKLEALDYEQYKKTVNKWKLKNNEYIQRQMERLDIECGKTAGNGDRIFLNEDEIREMKNSSLIDFGSHTVNHVILTNEDHDIVKWELSGSRAKLMKVTGNEIDTLSYPNGNYSEDIIKTAKDVGYKIACTAKRNRVGIGNNLMQLPRIDAEWDEMLNRHGTINKNIFHWIIR